MIIIIALLTVFCVLTTTNLLFPSPLCMCVQREWDTHTDYFLCDVERLLFLWSIMTFFVSYYHFSLKIMSSDINSNFILVSTCMVYLLPSLYFESVCVFKYETSLPLAAHNWVLFFYPHSHSVPFIWIQSVYVESDYWHLRTYYSHCITFCLFSVSLSLFDCVSVYTCELVGFPGGMLYIFYFFMDYEFTQIFALWLPQSLHKISHR